MKNIIRLTLSVLMTLTFVFSTMLQFHHHDISGNIYLYVTGIGEVELSNHCHPVGETCHNHHNCNHRHIDCTDNDSHSESECAMHLDETIVNDDTNVSLFAKSTDYYPSQAIIPEVTLLLLEQNDFDNSKIEYISHFVIESKGFLETISRRGPPVVA